MSGWIAVAVGGAAGSMLRYALSLLAVLMGGPSWPWGTLAANLLGSFGLGLLFVVGEGRTVAGVDARLLLGTGMMGGFTTYSTFNLEALRFAEAGQWGKVLLYIVSTVLVCLAAGAAGVALGRTVR